MKNIGIIYAFITFCALISVKLEMQAIVQNGDCTPKKPLTHLTRERSSPKKRLPTRKKSITEKKLSSVIQELPNKKIHNDVPSKFSTLSDQPKTMHTQDCKEKKPSQTLPVPPKQKYNNDLSKDKSTAEFDLAQDSSPKLFFSAAAISCFGVICYLIKQRVTRSHGIKLGS